MDLNYFSVSKLLKLFPSNPNLYMHRAACQLKQRNAIYAAQERAEKLFETYKNR